MRRWFRRSGLVAGAAVASWRAGNTAGNNPYDPAKDFAPVAALGTTSNLLIVNPALPVKSVQELVALARTHPGKLNYASAGIGTPPHLIGEMFKQWPIRAIGHAGSSRAPTWRIS